MAARPGPEPLDPERLLAEDRFVRGMARQLVRDAHQAEDLAQDTLLAALLRPPGPGVTLRAWLVTVLRRIAGRSARGARRVHARQAAAAQPEAVPATAEIVTREAQRAAVVRAVLELPEPARAVVVLRYFEHLTPRAIARRLDLPVETVRTRLKRAMAGLRDRLDNETAGGRSAWLAALLPFAKAPPGPLAAAAGAAHLSLTGVLLMTTKAKLLTCAAALGGLLLLAVWTLQTPAIGVPASGDPTVQSSPEGAPPPQAQSQSASRARVDAADSRTTAGREAVATSTTGGLRVQVQWGEDHTPATGIEVVLCREHRDELIEEPSAASDDQGVARFAGLVPGRLYAEVRRGSQSHSRWATIVAGQEGEATVEIEPGMHLQGIVVDRDDHPIAEAEVLAADWGGGEARRLARTGPDGRFALRSVSTHCHVGARAPGFAASRLRQFTAGKGARVELRIVLEVAAAELTGTVLDARDQPVPGTLVVAGSDEQGNEVVDGVTTMAPRPERTRSDAAGRFALRHLAPGEVPLVVRARGRAPWREVVPVKAGQNQVWVRLEPGVTLVGTVRDGAGAAVAKAQIQVEIVEPGQRASRTRGTSTAANGSYRIEGLAPGPLAVSATSDREGKASATLQAGSGETVQWDAVLTPGLSVRGLVLDADGKPVARAMVEAQVDGGRAADWFGFENTDAEGRFTLKNCVAGTTLRVTVRRKSVFPEARIAHLAPGPQELVIRLPREAWCWIQGKVLDPDGKPPPTVSVSPYMRGGSNSPAESVDAGTGAFRYGPYPPGEYQVRFQAAGHPTVVLPWRTLAPDEVWDLGIVQLVRGGSLLAQLALPDGVALPRSSFTVQDRDGATVDRVEVKDGVVRAGPLAPGDYRLQLVAAGVAATAQAFTVRAGVETRIELLLERGVAAALEFGLPAGSTPDGGLEVRLTGTDGGLLRTVCWPRATGYLLELALRPGTYQVEASRDGLRGGGTLTVAKGEGPARARVMLTKP